MTGLDTNILVRFVAQDDVVNSPRANAIMLSLSPEEPGWIAITAIAEFAWVMTRVFRISRTDVYSTIDMFLSQPHIVIEPADLVRKAADFFLTGSACSCRAAGCAQTLTFDRKAAKSTGITLA